MNKIKLMTHVVVGYPTLRDTLEIVKIMAEEKVDFIELQIPFTDPLADGPTIMRACEYSLQNGTRVADAFDAMRQLSKEVSTPLLFMAYYNTIFRYGVEKFCHDAEAAGAYGLIVPDMNIDEEDEEHFLMYCQKYHLNNIQVVSPASTTARLKKNAAVAKGFVYVASHQGITGARDELDPNLESFLKKVKGYFKVPIAVGFGISKPQHIRSLTGYADIAVVGSALLDRIARSNPSDISTSIKKYLKELRSIGA